MKLGTILCRMMIAYPNQEPDFFSNIKRKVRVKSCLETEFFSIA